MKRTIHFKMFFFMKFEIFLYSELFKSTARAKNFQKVQKKKDIF